MESFDGMMTVVCGLRDSKLAVTLIDSGRQYTLIPEAVTHPIIRTQNTTASQYVDTAMLKESGVQAMDGQYASTYKMMHCHVRPTSPPTLLTEFPPQRPDVSYGHGNFEIGGRGSGETYCLPTKCSSFKGGLCWTDRGSVFSARPMPQPDAFASSLRKYPSLSQEKSSEMLERLITYTQNKNSARNQKNVSPTRSVVPTVSNQTILSSRNSSVSKAPSNIYRPEVIIRPKRLEDSPVREKFKRPQPEYEQVESWRRPTFCKTNDIRYLRNLSRRARETTRILSKSSSHPERLNSKNDQGTQFEDPYYQNARRSSKSVNMEIQAVVPLVSREVVTVPLAIPSQRTIALPQTPTTSATEKCINRNIHEKHKETNKQQITQEVQSFEVANVSLQTTFSSVEICVQKHRSHRRSRSQEDFRTNSMGGGVLELLEALQIPSISKGAHRLNRKTCLSNNKYVYKGRDQEFENGKFKNILKVLNRMSLESRKNLTNSNVIQNPKRMPNSSISDQELAKVIKSWLSLVLITEENAQEKEFVLSYLFDLFKIRSYKFDCNWKHKLKSDIFDVVNIVTKEFEDNKGFLLNNLVDVLLQNVRHVAKTKCYKKTHTKCNKEYRVSTFKRYIPKEENELRRIIFNQIQFLLQNNYKFPLKRQNVQAIANDVISVFLKFMKTFYSENDIQDNLIHKLQHRGWSESQANNFVGNLLTHLKRAFVLHAEPRRVRSENMLVFPTLYSTNDSVKENNGNLSKFEQQSVNINVERYVDDLCNEINEWLDNLNIPKENEKGLKQVVVHDLASDIVDRYKYLELNPVSKGSDEMELEYLKYLIFKWVNKLVGKDNLKCIEFAPELMKRVKKLPIPKSFNENTNSPNSIPSENKNIVPNQNDLVLNENVVMSNIKPHTDYDADGSLNRHISSVASQVQPTDLVKILSEEQSPQLSTSIQLPINNPIKSGNEAQFIDNQVKNYSQSGLRESPLLDQLNNEYEEFVKDWVKQIPIPGNIFLLQDGATPEKVRLGIQNGIWKAVTKLNCEPSIFGNKFLYEDALDDEIESLLNCLPQTPELKEKKQFMKSKLIKKTTDTIERIHNNEISYINQLQKNITTVLNKYKGLGNEHEEPGQTNRENTLIKNLIENYILFERYKTDDVVKAGFYKNKFFHLIENLFDQLVDAHKNLFNLNAFQYDIINNIQKVSKPSGDILQNEVDKIILGFEVEQWISDLPVVYENSEIEERYKNQLKTVIMKKLEQVENLAVIDDFIENQLRSDIAECLAIIPLKDQNINVDFVIDEIVNRIKNQRNALKNTRRVVFLEPKNYCEFMENVPHSSSFIKTQIPNDNYTKIQQIRNTSNKMDCRLSCSKNNIDNLQNSQDFKHFRESFQPKEWHTLRDSIDMGRDDSCKYSEDTKIKFKRPSNQWHTLRECPMSNSQGNRQDMEEQSTSLYSEIGRKYDFQREEIPRMKNLKTISNKVSRSCCVNPSNIETENRLLNKSCPHIFIKSDTSIIKRPKTLVIRNPPNNNIITTLPKTVQSGTSQLNTENNKNYENNVNKPNQGETYKICTPSSNPYHIPLISVKCQTEPESILKLNGNQQQMRNVGTIASFTEFAPYQEQGCASTPRNTIIPSTPKRPNNKRNIPDKDAFKKHLDLDDSDDDDYETPCSCLEDSRKCKLRAKYFCDDCPRFFPIFYPHPLFW